MATASRQRTLEIPGGTRVRITVRSTSIPKTRRPRSTLSRNMRREVLAWGYLIAHADDGGRFDVGLDRLIRLLDASEETTALAMWSLRHGGVIDWKRANRRFRGALLLDGQAFGAWRAAWS